MSYYTKREIDDILKCSFCKIKFVEVVKLIPDCGNSICGYCYDEGTTLVNSQTKFKCKICDEEHSIPNKGFPDNKILLNLLQNEAKERPLTNQAKALKSSVEALNEKMTKLELFDQSIEINSHCEQLEIDVYTAAESAIQFIRKLEKTLMNEIDQYRSNLLGSKFVNTKKYLEKLSNEVRSFSNEWWHYFTNIDALRTDAEIEQAHKTINEFTLRIANSEKQLRNKLFNGFIMMFEAHDNYNRNTELIGRHLFQECIADETFIRKIDNFFVQ